MNAPAVQTSGPSLSEVLPFDGRTPIAAVQRVWLACLSDIFVTLCDWRGRSTWTSGGDLPGKVGNFIWENLSPESQTQAKLAIGHVVTQRENQQLDMILHNGERIRGWLLPLDSPDVAVCILGLRVPANLCLLSQRELDCVELLAQGIEPRVISERLDISVSTTHTHLKHAREKLGLPGIEALISFAARYCYPFNGLLGTQLTQKA